MRVAIQSCKRYKKGSNSMNAKALIGTVIETIVKFFVLAAAIILIFKGATKAYDFGYRVFADEPMSAAGGRTITVGIAEDADITDIAKMLEEKGLISDYRLFIVQELLSAQHDKIKPGIYDLSTDMKAEEMLEILASEGEEESSNTIAPNAETGDVTDPSEEDIENPENIGSEDMDVEVLPEDTTEPSEVTEAGE